MLVLINVFVTRLAAATITNVASFNGANGHEPSGTLIFDSAGNLYGTTSRGGTSNMGTVFELNPHNGAITTLASFSGLNGFSPQAELTFDSNGNLYGTTDSGGDAGFGTLFRVAAGTHALQSLASFNNSNGASPDGGLITDSAGNLYGTTELGGSYGDGTVFKYNPSTKSLAPLASPNFYQNGADPYGKLYADGAGNLFATANLGGKTNKGMIFKIAAGSSTVTTVASFDGTNGYRPQAGMIADKLGNLYGTTDAGGPYNRGVIFELFAGTNVLTPLAAFDSATGSQPMGDLIADAAGNLFGTTSAGGRFNHGTVFKLVPSTGTLTTVADLTDAENDGDPVAGLVADAAGNLYGTAYDGGAHGSGAVFKVSGAGFVVRADFNRNGFVDNADYNTWRSTFGSTTLLGADGNGNGIVDAGDYLVWRKAMSQSAGGGVSQPAPVPEPTLFSLVAGVLGSGLALGRSRAFERRRAVDANNLKL
ncbi:MAG TPA: choice-of-anchor tandem repeat GloVer-containing protein [Lacipirellulaceae bacterium]|nr:choice-of-anchor tandem repeat GloVer-containing protein [Lacipirellulaceae bacterium]